MNIFLGMGSAASMGPLSADRGNIYPEYMENIDVLLQWGRYQLIAEMRLPGAIHLGGCPASMGPLSADRGNEAGISDHPWELAASMGPLSADRGNAAPRVYNITPESLQWGRYQLIAEISAGRLAQRPNFVLQWGRYQLIAEMSIVMF